MEFRQINSANREPHSCEVSDNITYWILHAEEDNPLEPLVDDGELVRILPNLGGGLKSSQKSRNAATTLGSRLLLQKQILRMEKNEIKLSPLPPKRSIVFEAPLLEKQP